MPCFYQLIEASDLRVAEAGACAGAGVGGQVSLSSHRAFQVHRP